jgi:S1-C subfamily serine protease
MVRAVNNTPVPASVVALDSKIDLALMKTATRPIKVAPLRVTPPVSVGDQIVVFGFPLSGMLSSTGNATFGNISATLGMLDNPNHFQISAAVQTGNSGGPLLDSSGNVIGIVFAKLGIRAAALTGDLPQNINFAVKSSVAAKFLTDEGIAFETSEKTA